MRGILQKVNYAKVLENESTVLEIKEGVCVFVGISEKDVEKDVEYIAKKILGVRVFDHDSTSWKKSVFDCKKEVLCVPQVELLKEIKVGDQPEIPSPMAKGKAKNLYEKLIEKLSKLYDPTKVFSCEFGAKSDISMSNDGPVTIFLESQKATIIG
ncbi:D-tyrosyl-tRNA(Tyr) deacylase 1 [Smittium mucronatum]|uniref:D-aminoacyl-tRNA deacylase n=1 Tax=Smittium mucronatum TaxID=133383 RepID=A0A1R0GT19_9FUNG|nr:D-tyrosyl-tRNA(Tyr) deacylase 1 [Smittium mucronatum]